MKLTKDRIDEIFDAADTTEDYVVGLFKEVVPGWENVEKIDGFVACGRAMGDFIMKRAIKFDTALEPDEEQPRVMRGGMWMNSGFSTVGADELGDWEISLPNITYKGCQHPGPWWVPSPTGPRIGTTHCLSCAQDGSRELGWVKPRRRGRAFHESSGDPGGGESYPGDSNDPCHDIADLEGPGPHLVSGPDLLRFLDELDEERAISHVEEKEATS